MSQRADRSVCCFSIPLVSPFTFYRDRIAGTWTEQTHIKASVLVCFDANTHACTTGLAYSSCNWIAQQRGRDFDFTNIYNSPQLAGPCFFWGGGFFLDIFFSQTRFSRLKTLQNTKRFFDLALAGGREGEPMPTYQRGWKFMSCSISELIYTRLQTERRLMNYTSPMQTAEETDE